MSSARHVTPSIAACSGAATITVDLKKNGTTILTGVITLDNHRLTAGNKVLFFTTGALPTGLSAETWYYVITVTEHTFKVAATRDGTPGMRFSLRPDRNHINEQFDALLKG